MRVSDFQCAFLCLYKFMKCNSNNRHPYLFYIIFNAKPKWLLKRFFFENIYLKQINTSV